jgi:hypothetical protein
MSLRCKKKIALSIILQKFLHDFMSGFLLYMCLAFKKKYLSAAKFNARPFVENIFWKSIFFYYISFKLRRNSNILSDSSIINKRHIQSAGAFIFLLNLILTELTFTWIAK